MTSRGAKGPGARSELAHGKGIWGCQEATGDGMLAKAGRCKDQLYHEVEDHPVRTVAAAVGAGYVLGGGLFSRLTGRIVGTALRLALRMAAVSLVSETIVALTETALSRARHRDSRVHR